MRNRLILIAFLLLMGGWPAYSQQVTGNITAVDTSGACTTANGYVKTQLLSNDSSLVVQVSGTFSGTLQFLVTVDGSTYSTVLAYPPNSTTGATTTTSTGKWSISVGGWKGFCIDASALASGTAAITINHNAGVNTGTLTGGGGGGSGTVTSVSGTPNEVSVASPTTTPVISLPSALSAPGYVAQATNLLDPRNAAFAYSGHTCVGDGTDTSTQATGCWQAAVTQMEATNGAISCPAGTRWSLNRVQLSGFDVIDGAGDDPTHDGCLITATTDAAFVPAVPTNFIGDVTIENIAFAGGSNPIDIPFVNHIVLEHLHFAGQTGCAVALVGGERDILRDITADNGSTNGFATLCTGDPAKSIFSGSIPATLWGTAHSLIDAIYNLGSSPTHYANWLWWAGGNGLGTTNASNLYCFYSCSTGELQVGSGIATLSMENSIIAGINPDHIAEGLSAVSIAVNFPNEVDASRVSGYDPGFNGSLNATTEMAFSGGVYDSAIENMWFDNTEDNVTTFGLSITGPFYVSTLTNVRGAVYNSAPQSMTAFGLGLGPTNLPAGNDATTQIADVANKDIYINLCGSYNCGVSDTATFHIWRNSGASGSGSDDLAISSTAATFAHAISAPSMTLSSTPLAKTSGGTGTTTPSASAGSGITITGTWPNQTFAATSFGNGTAASNGVGIVLTGTSYAPLYGTYSTIIATAANAGQTVGAASAYVSNLQVTLSNALSGSQTLVVTLYDVTAAAGEAVTCTIPNSGTSCTDTTDSYSVPAGHLVAWQTVLNSAADTSNVTIGAQTGAAPTIAQAIPWSYRGSAVAASGTVFTATANKASVLGFYLPYSVTTGHLGYEVGTTSDNTAATYDIGYYTGSSGGTCTLVADLGATAGTTFANAASTIKSLAFQQGTVTIPAGRIYEATTTSQTGTLATMFKDTTVSVLGFLQFTIGNVSITTGGTLPSSFTCPTDTNTTGSYGVALSNAPDIVLGP